MNPMISTKIQLSNANVVCAKKLGERILSLYSKHSQLKTKLTKSLFEKSFQNTESYDIYQQLVRKVSEKYIINDNNEILIILPPIILRSNSNFVLRYKKMIIIFELNGPIIPVITESCLKECQEFITHLYRIHSEQFIGNYNQFMKMFNT